jgi:antitoxin VapB
MTSLLQSTKLHQSTERTTAKLFMNGRSQAVRLPAFCRFDGQEVYVEKVGDQVILTPHRPSWTDFFASHERPSNDFMQEREQAVFTERESFEQESFK